MVMVHKDILDKHYGLWLYSAYVYYGHHPDDSTQQPLSDDIWGIMARAYVSEKPMRAFLQTHDFNGNSLFNVSKADFEHELKRLNFKST